MLEALKSDSLVEKSAFDEGNDKGVILISPMARMTPDPYGM
jgi:hypothetical protein